MTKQEILERAIKKAISGGFKHYDHPEEELDVASVYYYFDDDHGNLSINDLIWRHDFAKALWGEEQRHVGYENNFHDYTTIPAWEWHLQKMVVAPDPLKYLGDNL